MARDVEGQCPHRRPGSTPVEGREGRGRGQRRGRQHRVAVRQNCIHLGTEPGDERQRSREVVVGQHDARRDGLDAHPAPQIAMVADRRAKQPQALDMDDDCADGLQEVVGRHRHFDDPSARKRQHRCRLVHRDEQGWIAGGVLGEPLAGVSQGQASDTVDPRSHARGHGVEHQRRLGNRRGDRPWMIERGDQRVEAFARDAVVRRLQANDAAISRRRTDRSAGVASHRDADHARRDRGRRAGR